MSHQQDEQYRVQEEPTDNGCAPADENDGNRKMAIDTEDLFDLANDIIYTLDLNGYITTFNETALSIYGYTREETEGVHIEHLVDPEYRELVKESIRRKADGEIRSNRYELLTRKKDGTPVWVEVNARLIDTTRGTEILGIARDITDRKTAEMEKEKSENRFKAMITHLSDIIWVIEPDVTIKWHSPSLKRILGYEDSYLIGRKGTDYIHPDDMDVIGSEMAKVVKKKNDYTPTPFRFRHRDGHWVWLEATANNMMDNPYVNGIVITTRYIGDRVRAENALKESEKKYRTLFEGANDAIIILEGEKFVECNREAMRIYGCERHELIGKRPWELSPERQPDGCSSITKARKLIEQTMENGSIRFYWKNKRCDGSLFDGDVSLSTIELHGKIYLQTVLRDITESRKKEKEIIEHRNRAKFYLDLLGHDIGNLHQGIFTSLQLADLYMEDESRREMALKNAMELTLRSMGLSKNVLLLSRITSLPREFRTMDMKEVVTGSVEEMSQSFSDVDIDLDLDTEKGDTLVYCEPIIEQLFSNILHNAVQVQQNTRPWIGVSIRNREDRVRIDISDKGPGIPENMKRTMFNRIERSSDRAHTGVGLTLVRELVERYRGEIEIKDRVEGDPEKGALFRISLPRAD